MFLDSVATVEDWSALRRKFLDKYGVSTGQAKR